MSPRRPPVDAPPLLTSGEVAAQFRVTPRTVARWESTGRLTAVSRTLGGHRRYLAADVQAIIAAAAVDRSP